MATIVVKKRRRVAMSAEHATRKSIDSSSLSGGGKLYPAQNGGLITEDDRDLSDREKAKAPPNLRAALSPSKLGEVEPGHLQALHREAHDAWDSLRSGADGWQPRHHGSRSGRTENVRGMKVAIEHDRGEVRTGKGGDGREWSRLMKWPYGYITGSVGLDGEPVDVYLGPDAEAPDAFVVHQAKVLGPGEIGGYDEDKVMLGFPNEQAAREAYLAHMPDARFLGGVTRMPVDELRDAVSNKESLKKWAKTAKTLADAPLTEGGVIAQIAKSLPPHETFVEVFSQSAQALTSKAKSDLEVVCAETPEMADDLRARKAAGEARVADARILSKTSLASDFDGAQSLYFVDARSKTVNQAQLIKLVDGLQGKWMMIAPSTSPVVEAMKQGGAHVKYAMTLGKDPGDRSTWLAAVSNFPMEGEGLSDSPSEKAAGGPGRDGAASSEPADAEEELDVEKTIFSSNSSKRSVADKLASVLPDHDVYVEPFVGSGAVFFQKKPAKNFEVLSDLDPNVPRAYRAIKSLTAATLSRLEKMDWRGNKRTLLKLHAFKPRDEVGFLHKFLYQKRFSIFGMPTSFRVGAEGTVAKVVDKVKKHVARLRQAKIMSGDYEKVAKDFDSPDTLHFLDPPYKGKDAAVGEKKWDDDRFYKVVHELKGKVAITLDAYSPLVKRFADDGYTVKFFAQKRKIANWRPKLGADLWQALITNYALPAAEWLRDEPPAQLTTKATGPMAADDVQAAHSNLSVEMIRRGMPHDSLLLPLFPDRSEDAGLGEEHPDVAGEEGEALAKVIAKRAGIPEEAAKDWLAEDAEAAQHSAQDFPEMKEGEGGDAAVVTLERGLSDDQAADMPPAGWEPLADQEINGVPDEVRLLAQRAKAGDAGPLREMLAGAEPVSQQERESLKRLAPPVCHTLVMLKTAAGWGTIRVASPGAQHAGSGLLAAHKSGTCAVADARLSPVTEPVDKVWKSDDGTWTRVKVQARCAFKAGKQSDGWREFSLSGGPVDGGWVLQKVVAGTEEATLLRKTDSVVEKRAVHDIDAEIVEVSKREEERVVTGVVLQPETTDAQGDIYSADVIKKTAYNFLAKYGRPGGSRLGFMHSDFSRPFELVESWISPEDTTIGGKQILKGTWMMSVRVLDDRVWRGIKERRFKGFSIGGVAKVQRLSAA